MTEKTELPMQNQYDDEAARRLIAEALTLAADTIAEGGRFTAAVTPGRYSDAMLQGLVTAEEAVRHVAAAFSTGRNKTPEDIIAAARAKLAEWTAKTPEDMRKQAGDEIIKALREGMKAQGMTDEEISATLDVKDKLEPDGEDPELVIRRVFKTSLDHPGNATAEGLVFGRASDNRPYGIFKATNGKEEVFPVMVACAGDAHATGASTIFANEQDARNYVAAEFDPALRPGAEGKVEKRTIN